jgi:hypothetical protein
MVSLRVCQGGWFVAATAAAFVLTTFATAGPAAAAESDADGSQRQLDQIQEMLSSASPFSAELLEPLTGLALLYQEADDHALALVALERAIQVLRVNRGLHTLDQVPLLRQKMRSEEARENHAAVWELEQQLLTLARRHSEDLRAAAVFAEIADRQMEALDEYIDGKRPPEVIYGCFYKQWPRGDGGSCIAGSRKIVVQGMLAEAQRNYADAIGVLLRNGLYGSEDLRELEMNLLRGVDLVRTLYYDGAAARPLPMVPEYVGAESIEPWRSRIAAVAQLASWELPYPTGRSLEAELSGNVVRKHLHMMSPYHRGRQSLRRLYAYGAASSTSALGQAGAVVQMADWDLLYSHNGQAVASYGLAHEMLERAAVPHSSIEELFAPATPVVLPAFQPNPLARDESRPSTGHIDVEFEITKYGRGRAVEIQAAVNATDDAVDHLVTLIKSSRFRPRLVGGTFADASPVAMRYYLY